MKIKVLRRKMALKNKLTELKKTPSNFETENKLPEPNVRETGWKPLPLSLKILLVVTGLSIIASIFAFGKAPTALFGFLLTGVPGIIASIVLNLLAPGIMFFSVLKRLPWAWKYSLAYLGFFLANGLIGFAVFITSSGVKDIAGITILMLFVLAIELGLLIAVFRQKRYFE